MNRREFASMALAGVGAGIASTRVLARGETTESSVGKSADIVLPRQNAMAGSGFSTVVGEGLLSVLSDGHLQLPASFLQPEGIDDAALKDLLIRYQLNGDTYAPACNISVWQQGDRTVLFDVGAGSQFMSSAGQLPGALDAAGIDPESVTDVILTHAHPDHLWGLLDDFDDLLYANATIHIHRDELDYWQADDTLSRTPESRQTFVVGAQSRLARAEEQLSVFGSGDEVLPGIEALDTRGHTPGHTSRAIHDGGESVLIVGDALNNVALSFEYPGLPSPADQDPELAAETRMALLDRLAADQMRLIGFHLPTPGFGRVERGAGRAYRFVAEEA